MGTNLTLAEKVRIAVISCPHDITDKEIILRIDPMKGGINVTGQLFERIDEVTKEFAGPTVNIAEAVLSEIARLTPNYQSQMSAVDAGRRQMLEHFDRFVRKIVQQEATDDASSSIGSGS